jgi:signal transduction histidine kinase
LNSVLGNLISNSIKFSDPESEIFISAYSKGDKVVFVIRDYGMGMPKEIVSDLFSLAKTTSRPGTQGELGAGYGMPILKMYLDLFDAHVVVLSKTAEESETDKGVCVIIEFQKSEVPEIECEESFYTQQTNLSTLS